MLRFFSLAEKIALVVLMLVALSTGYYMYDRFVREHSDVVATEGGIYTEGVVGRPQFLNPVLLLGNQVDRDISQLVFSGLTRYNPHTGLIEDDIATSEKSKDNLTYTFTILGDAMWHDGTPVTADDVVFTYKNVIQSSQFKNSGLKQSFADVSIEKVTQRVVRFKLDKPYSFFLANVTVGILPKHLLELVPVDNLDKSEFNQNPIGTGPYRFVSWTAADETHEVTLQKNDEYYAALPKIQTVIFRAFPDQSALLLAENTLSGYRLNTDLSAGSAQGSSGRFQPFDYRLPQYSALFLNGDSDILSNKKVRFALLLATDKDKILELVKDAEVVDTPILESKADLDIEFSLERAMGAFFDTEWHLPGKSSDEVKKQGNEEKTSDGAGGPAEMKLIDEAAELKFTLKAVEDSWISLQLDGVQQQSFLLKKDQSKEFTVKTALTFTTIGNAAGVALQVNGVALKSLGNQGQVLRNLKLDRASLEDYVVETVVPEPAPPALTPSLSQGEREIPSTSSPSTPPAGEDGPVEEPEESTPEDEELAKVRENNDGKRLILRLVTAQEPPIFLLVAEEVRKQWLEAGAKVVIETYSMVDLQEKITKRDYDILLFGQNLGYNLDAFPFWHSSQAETGLNLSNYRSLEADNLLVSVRTTFDERTKQELLDKLKKIIAEDTPAVFLYNPTHSYVIDQAVRNVQLGKLSSHSDRFTDLLNWYLKEDYELTDDFSFTGVFKWIFGF